MRRKSAIWGMVLGVVAGILVLGTAPIARADDTTHRSAHGQKTSITNGDKNSDMNKQVGFIDLYLTDAINNAKLLSSVADAAAGENDRAVIAEAQRNLDQAIDQGLLHVTKLRSYKGDLAMAAGAGSAALPDRQDMGGDTKDKSTRAASGATGTATSGSLASAKDSDRLGKLDELERHLKEAKAADKKLAGAQMNDLSAAVDSVATHLMGADAAFRDVAKWTNYTRLSSTNLSTVPVRGDQMPPGEIDRELDRDKTGTPAASPGKGEDTNLRGPKIPDATREPTQPAPGGSGPKR